MRKFIYDDGGEMLIALDTVDRFEVDLNWIRNTTESISYLHAWCGPHRWCVDMHMSKDGPTPDIASWVSDLETIEVG